MLKIGVAAALAALLATSAAHAADKASAELKDAKGNVVGVIEFAGDEDGVLLKGKLSGLTPGEHGFHIHEVGKCEGPDFKSAGGHFNPEGASHGKVDGGQHAGDMDNLVVEADGTVSIDFSSEFISLKDGEKDNVLDADGSAVVIHAKADDYKSQPAGDAGGRVACGVIQ